MGYYNFEKDLEQSMNDMTVVSELLKSKGAENIEPNDNKDFDLYFTMNNKSYTVEIKHDYLYSKTNNVAIEVKSRGKHSGLKVSKASMWCYILDNDVYFVNTNKLRKFIDCNSFKTVNGGDEWTSSLVLVPLPKFKEIFVRIA